MHIAAMLLALAFLCHEEVRRRRAVNVRFAHLRDRVIAAHIRLDRHILRPEENEIDGREHDG